MRTDENQQELTLDVPMTELLACRSEADAVRKCLRLAYLRYGRDQKTVAAMTGWKSDSCLSEAASAHNKRRIPESKLHRFAVATGCNLVSQYREYKRAEDQQKGLTKIRDEADRFAAMMLRATQRPEWRAAA